MSRDSLSKQGMGERRKERLGSCHLVCLYAFPYSCHHAAITNQSRTISWWATLPLGLISFQNMVPNSLSHNHFQTWVSGKWTWLLKCRSGLVDLVYSLEICIFRQTCSSPPSGDPDAGMLRNHVEIQFSVSWSPLVYRGAHSWKIQCILKGVLNKNNIIFVYM